MVLKPDENVGPEPTEASNSRIPEFDLMKASAGALGATTNGRWDRV